MMRDHHGEDNDDSDEDEDGEDDGGEVADYPGLPPRVHCSRRLHVGSEKIQGEETNIHRKIQEKRKRRQIEGLKKDNHLSNIPRSTSARESPAWP